MKAEEFFDCEECGAPASVTWATIHHGVDFDGSDALFALERVDCCVGHHYNRTVLAAKLEGGE